MSVQTVAEAHPSNNHRGHAFGIRHRFVGRHIVSQIVFVDASEAAQKGPQARACSFTTVAMDLAYAIAVIITCPFLHTVANARVPGMHIRIVRCFIGIQDRTCWRHISFHNRTRGWFVGMLEHPIAHLVASSADQTQDWWPVALIAALAFTFIGAPARWVGHVAMGRTFFPPRSDTAHPPRTPFPSSVHQGGWCRDWFGSADATRRGVCDQG